MTNLAEDNDGRTRLSIQDGDRDDPDAAPDADSSSEDGIRSSVWDHLDAGIFGDFQALGNLDLVGPEGDPEGTRRLDQALAEAAISNFSFPEKRHRILGGKLARDLEEEFEEGPQRKAFCLIRERFRAAFLPDSHSERQIEQALLWIFARTEDPVTLDTCCIALDARVEPLQLRLQYEWYQRWLVFTNPLPFEASGIPFGLQNEILFVAGTAGVRVASDIWFNPGIERSRVLAMAERLGVTGAAKAFDVLDEQNLIRNRNDIDPRGEGSWYLPGRRPRQRDIPR